tara:strand:- start:999 stop:1367 length:369 start_codon:yes stop_codon:yes gene_type:complete
VTTYIVDKNNVTSLEASDVTKPSDRNFRDAWVLNSDKDVITEDVTAAKDLFKDKIRQIRAPLLQALDIEYMRLQETGSDTSTVVAKKQALRDAPAAAAISNASTINELKAAWDASVLGANPY